MSSLLKEAIVDAKALRESALKSAETSIIEKYSDEVKQTLDQLLEQDELGMDTDSPTTDEEVAKNIPLAATDNLSEEEGDMPDMNKEGDEIPVTIDLEALQEAVAALESDLEESEEIELTEEDLADILGEADKDGDGAPAAPKWSKEPGKKAPKWADKDDNDPDVGDSLEEDAPAGVEAAAEEEADSDAMSKAGLEEAADDDDDGEEAVDAAVMGEEFDSDSLVDAIMEKLTVDMGADLSGWAGRSSASLKLEIEKELAHRRSTDVEEELDTLKKAQEELVFENKQLNEHLSQHKQAFQELKESLQDVNLSNARLLYTNRVLRNTSLNERQKEKIVEAISNAGSVTEAKVICETLQNTVETKPKRRPQSLSEAIGNKRSSVIRASRQESTPSDPFNERMKRLAGIK